MNKAQIVVVEICNNGSYCGLYLNGEYVISADPGCGDVKQTVYDVAESLAGIYCTDVIRVPINPDVEWQWGDIEKRVFANGEVRWSYLPPMYAWKSDAIGV